MQFDCDHRTRTLQAIMLSVTIESPVWLRANNAPHAAAEAEQQLGFAADSGAQEEQLLVQETQQVVSGQLVRNSCRTKNSFQSGFTGNRATF